MIPIKNFTPIGVDPELPPGYTACEYLESTGTQYIITDLPVKYSRVVCKANSASVVNDNHMFGWRDLRTCCYHLSYWSSSWSWGNGSADFADYTAPEVSCLSPHVFDLCASNDTEFTIDGEVKATTTLDFSLCPESAKVYLFARYHGYSTYKVQPGKWMIYWFKILDIRDNTWHTILPALDPSGVPCMYDTVSKKTYYNQGTGNFSYKTIDRGSVYLYDASDFVKGEHYNMYGDTVISTFGKSYLDGKTHRGTIRAANEPTGQYSPVRWTCSNYHIIDHLIIGNDVTGTSAASVYGITDDGTYELIGDGPRWTGTDTIVMTKFKPYKKFELRCHRPGWTNRVYVDWIDAYMRY